MLRESAYLPFEPLLQQLRERGFDLGVDGYLRVQRLLEAEAGKGASLDVFKHKLCALLARSPGEQALFRQLFDAYAEEMGYSAPPSPPPEPRFRWRLAAGILGGLGLLLALLVWNSRRCPDTPLTISAFQQPQRLAMQLFYAGPRDSLQALRWDFGDGSSDTVLHSPVHAFARPGVYVVRLHIRTVRGCGYDAADTVAVAAPRRIRADFRYELQTRQAAFRSRSVYYADSVSGDLPRDIRLRWDLGDGTSATGDSIRHTYAADGEYTVRLIASAVWPDTLAADTAVQTVSVTGLPRVPLSSLPLEREDLSGLLRPRALGLLLGLACGLVLLLYLAVEALLAWRRRVRLRDLPPADRRPPFRQKLRFEPPELDYFETRAFYEAAQSLRRRRLDSEQPLLDIPRSIRRTLRNGGYPALAYAARSRPAQYLVLIETQGRSDHLAALFQTLTEELARRDISAEYYFYTREPRVVWKTRSQPLVLDRLLGEYPDYRLLIVGEGDAFLAEENDAYGLAAWTRIFDSWSERAFLSTRPTEAWGFQERELARRFVLAPATSAGLSALADQWLAEEPLTPAEWRRAHYEIEAPAAGSPDLIPELRAYLGTPGLQWLAACALYPVLYWELTLGIGKRLSGRLPDAGYPLHDLSLLVHLLRLPWFRAGEMPYELRRQLVPVLADADARDIRAYLLQVMDRAENQPKPGSYAELDQQVRRALYLYLNSSQTPADLDTLKAAISALDPADLEDSLSVEELRKVRDARDPLALLLPWTFFRGKIPLLGLRRRYRMALAGTGIAAAGLLCLMLLGSPRSYEPDRVYAARELRLGSPADSARWLNHNAALLADSLSPDSLRRLLDAAMRLDSSGLPLRRNHAAARYRQGLERYRQDSLQAAADSFALLARLLPLVPPDAPAIQARYALGLTDLRLGALRPAAQILDSIFLQPLPDTRYRDSLRAAVSRLPAWRELLRLSLARSREPAERQVFAALLDSLPQVQDSAALHRRSVERGDSLMALQNYVSALAAYQEAVRWQAADAALRSKIARCETEIARLTQEEKYQEARRSADADFQRGLWAAAAESYALALSYLPGDAYAAARILECRYQDALARGSSARAAGDADAARRAFEEALQIKPGDAAAQELLAALQPILLSGIIREASGSPVSGAAVAAEGGAEALSGADGRYSLSLAPGTSEANLRVSAPGYEAQTGVWRAGAGSADFTLQREAAPPPADLTAILAEIERNMASIPGGSFKMGSSDGESDEKPVHEVRLSGFMLSRYEVTNAQYAAFLNDRGNQEEDGVRWYNEEGPGYKGYAEAAIRQENGRWTVKAGRENHPVNYVSWYGAAAFARWAGEKTGRAYRLPTEAEWEYAAGGGLRDRDAEGNLKYRYAGSDNLDEVAWYTSNTNDTGTRPVGGKRANGLGLYDMSGNVWEWCSDWYGDYPARAQTNPEGPSQGVFRVLRGGGWDSYAELCRVALRNNYVPVYRFNYAGFRLARQ